MAQLILLCYQRGKIQANNKLASDFIISFISIQYMTLFSGNTFQWHLENVLYGLWHTSLSIILNDQVMARVCDCDFICLKWPPSGNKYCVVYLWPCVFFSLCIWKCPVSSLTCNYIWLHIRSYTVVVRRQLRTKYKQASKCLGSMCWHWTLHLFFYLCNSEHQDVLKFFSEWLSAIHSMAFTKSYTGYKWWVKCFLPSQLIHSIHTASNTQKCNCVHNY